MPRKKADSSATEKNKRKRKLSNLNQEDDLVDVVSNSQSDLRQKTLKKINLEDEDVIIESDFSVIDVEAEDSTLCEVAQPDDDEEEEAWLDALEKGNLDDSGGLKKNKDPSLMTARQRALKERTSASASKSFANVNLLGRSKQMQAMTEEAKKRKEEKNKRRKLQAVKKVEETQKQTIERLIKQQGSKVSKERQKKTNGSGNGNSMLQQKSDPKVVAMVKYCTRGKLVSLSFPEGHEFPIKAMKATFHSTPICCAVCGNPKKYSCSKTGVPLCSLSCYKSNLSATKQAS